MENFTVLYQILSYAARRYGGKIAYRQPEGRRDSSFVSFARFKWLVNDLRAAIKARGMLGRRAADPLRRGVFFDHLQNKLSIDFPLRWVYNINKQ